MQFQTDLERRVLTPDAVEFLIDLESEFGWRRGRMLARRQERELALAAGEQPDFLDSTGHVRTAGWQVAPVPDDLVDRRVEITGPVDAKMMINALNSGARVFMADFEDATSPTWDNLLQGQINIVEAYRRTLQLETDTKSYRIGESPATMVVRPRGWHLEEKHFLVEGRPMSASLFDFGLYMFHGARAALEAGTGPYLYLPKLESHLEARLWNDVFVWSQGRMGLERGTIRATVLIENVLAAFEMEEILYELREHAAGLNAGRWDYIFSVIKKFRTRPEFILPDRAQVTMTVPFMHAYTELLVKTCHKRGTHAIGGMAAFIPNRRDPEVTERAIAAVAADKRREARAGCDGTWVAHPDLVPVAMKEFDAVLGSSSHQIDRRRDDVEVTAEDLLNMDFPGEITMEGVRNNVSVGVQYLASWLSGVGAAAIDNLMEDVATAEISRSQICQWVKHGATASDGTRITEDLVRSLVEETVQRLEAGNSPHSGELQTARKVFEEVALGDQFVDFLTLPAYDLIT